MLVFFKDILDFWSTSAYSVELEASDMKQNLSATKEVMRKILQQTHNFTR